MEPLNTLPPYNLFGLDDQNYKRAKVVVLPIPYDATLTYRSGARDGPHAIIDASRNIELYSYELKRDISKIGIYTTNELAPDLSSAENMIKRVKKEVGLVLDDKKIPFMLGGDHSITIGALDAYKERKQDISVIQFDAHSDTRDEIFNSKYTHASVMARAREKFSKVVQIGIRSIDEDSAKKYNNIIYADEVKTQKAEKIAEKINKICGKSVYITIDLDVLDPSEMPSVGTPEPNGLTFNELTSIIKNIAKKKELAGLDMVELSPIPYLTAPNFTAAKLAYLTLGYFL